MASDFIYVYLDIIFCTYDLFWYRCYRDCSSSAATKIIQVWSRVKQCCSSRSSVGLVWYILPIGYPIFVAKMEEKNVISEKSVDVDEDVGLWGATSNSWLPCAWSKLSCADFSLILECLIYCIVNGIALTIQTIAYHQNRPDRGEGRQLSIIKSASQRVNNCLPSNRPDRR